MITARLWLATSGVALFLGQSIPAYAGPLQDAVGAGDGWTIKGTLRSRTEAIDGQFRPNVAESDFFQSFRTTILTEYDTGPIRIGAEVIDARGYGQKSNSSVGTSEVNPLELSQAYLAFDLDGRFGEGSKGAVTVGRFTLSVGSKRLLDSYGASNRVTAYTGANLDWKNADGDRLVALWAMPHLREPDDAEGIRENHVQWDPETTDVQLFGGSFTKAKALGGSVEIYGYRLAERDSAERPTTNRRVFTTGGRLFRGPDGGKFDWDLEGAYQFGEVRASRSTADVRDLDVSAWFVHAEAGRTFGGAWAPRIALLFDQASGDKANPATYNRFDSLFGSRRTDLGPVGLYGPVSRANIVTPGLRLEVEPNDRTDVALTGRALWLDSRTDSFGATSVRDRAGRSGSFAGSQYEVRVRYWLVPKLIRLDGTAAYLSKGRFLRDAPNAPNTGDTIYAGLDINVDF